MANNRALSIQPHIPRLDSPMNSFKKTYEALDSQRAHRRYSADDSLGIGMPFSARLVQKSEFAFSK
jgi:hypothetical protein